MFLHRSDLNISEFFHQFFAIFGNFCKILLFFKFFLLIVAQILMKFCRNFADNLEKLMLKFSEIFEFSREKSYFERIRMVRMVRSLADRTFQLWGLLLEAGHEADHGPRAERLHGRVLGRAPRQRPGEAAVSTHLVEGAGGLGAVLREVVVDVHEALARRGAAPGRDLS